MGELPVATFDKCGDRYCTDEAGLRAIIKRDAIRDAYDEKLLNTINGCNKVLK